MTEIIFTKAAGGALVPVDQAGVDYLAKMKLGAGVRFKATRVTPNNYKFHKKMWALLDLAFDAWEPIEPSYKGEVVAKNKEQFREDITILAGFYTTAVRMDNSIRFSAKSWSFESMDDDEKERLYSAIINVVLAKVLTRYTRADLDNVINQLLGFT